METSMTIIWGLALGIGLAAACGFRVFVPLLVYATAARVEWVSTADGFEWLHDDLGLAILAIATLAEVGAYFVPWVDNALDTVSSPAAVIAAILLTAACLEDVSPSVRWTAAAILGGGTAGTIKLGMGATRVGSTATTGGAANPVLSALELVASLVMSVMAIVVPMLTALGVVMVLGLVLRAIWRRALRVKTATAAR